MTPNSNPLALVFPGQGSQVVGMGRDLAEAYPVAAEVFAEVDEALGQKLSQIMFEGPEDTLRLTENAQPALMAVSMAVIRVLAENGFQVEQRAGFVAGHSLGEYSALIAAGTFGLADGAQLLKQRGQAMQQAVPVGEGAMAALLGLDMATAKVVADEAAEGEICTAANDNAPGQVVISGARNAVERAIQIARAHGAKRGILLPVSAPFHCALMAPAAEAMAEALAVVRMESPKVPLIANITAGPVVNAPEIRRLLVEQVTGMVRWRESVQYMKSEGVEKIIEIGSGKVLSGLVRRIDRDLPATSIGTPEDIDAFLGEL
ncbi:MAG TPA: [acyl-carrier-protein] S-malonyltransferase [Rhodospirillales bacterium]|nr:[acyl-carrier-protein] S-malonyltransferase [Rhodospirillales bacterium]